MLVSLHVKDLALIDEIEVLWKDGLNILTGETGTGKSVIIGSVRLALGAAMSSVMGNKGDRDCIRTGAEYALVELIFQSKKKDVIQKLKNLDLPIEEDGTIFIQRKIMPTRSVCKVNGETTTGKQLKELASLLIDIHGQHDTQSLLNVKKHSQILDDYGADEIYETKEALKLAFSEYETNRKELQKVSLNEDERRKELSFAEFEVKEIAAANLKVGEDEELEERFRKMNHSRKIAEALNHVQQAISDSGEGNAMDGISFALRELKLVSDYDESLAAMEEQLMTIDDLLSEVNRNVSSYLENSQFSAEEYQETEERLNQYNLLKSKYGNSVEKILQYYEEQEKKIEQLSNYDSYLQSLKEKLQKSDEKVFSLSQILSKKRKSLAVILSEEMESSIRELNFANVDFVIQINSDESKRREDGFDDVEFMISLNPGEPRKPLNLVASGGELSRIMLALKTIMADKEQIETVIFDEIDAGISGKTAWKVSEQMAILAKFHQLICITHLPQIAAMADAHYVIEKKTDESHAITNIRSLNEKQQLEEIARLLGSDVITDAAVANAVELKKMAKEKKKLK